MSTPGSVGRPGKWPAKKASSPVRCQRPRAGLARDDLVELVDEEKRGPMGEHVLGAHSAHGTTRLVGSPTQASLGPPPKSHSNGYRSVSVWWWRWWRLTASGSRPPGCRPRDARCRRPSRSTRTPGSVDSWLSRRSKSELKITIGCSTRRSRISSATSRSLALGHHLVEDDHVRDRDRRDDQRRRRRRSYRRLRTRRR